MNPCFLPSTQAGATVFEWYISLAVCNEGIDVLPLAQRDGTVRQIYQTWRLLRMPSSPKIDLPAATTQTVSGLARSRSWPSPWQQPRTLPSTTNLQYSVHHLIILHAMRNGHQQAQLDAAGRMIRVFGRSGCLPSATKLKPRSRRMRRRANVRLARK